MFKNQKVLVTGGKGMIGRHLVKILIHEYQANVTVTDLPTDLRDRDACAKICKGQDYIFHLAAFFANQNSVDYPERDLLVSQLGTVKMLEHAVLQGGIQRFVYAGSGCAIYGAQAPLPLKEEFISMHLSTPYQISKMAGELYCNFYWHHYG